jgi:hypothetical protein
VPPCLLPGIKSVAVQAAHQLPIAVQFGQQLLADAGAAVEVIGVLRYEESELAEPLELDEGKVGWVRFDLARWDLPPRRWQASITPRPHSFGTAEVGDSGVGAYACAREDYVVLTLDDPPSNLPDVFVEAIHVSFLIAYSGTFDALWSNNSLQRIAEYRERIFPDVG